MPQPETRRTRWSMRSDRAVWISTFLAVFLLSSAWAIASPYFSGPDEPAHVVRAYAVAHGDLTGRDPNDARVPGYIVAAPPLFGSDPGCYAFEPSVTAECLSLNGSKGEVEQLTSAGRHPPLYYFLVGVPTWLGTGGWTLLLMRAVSAAIAAAFVASAMVTARRPTWGRWTGPALLVATTPMCFYLFGLVNPNGTEIAAAILAWTAGAVLVTEPEVSRRVLVRFTVGAGFLIMIRQLGPLWMAVLGGVLLVLAGRRTLTLVRRKDVLVALGILVALGVVQCAWLLYAGPLDATRAGMPPLDLGTSDIWRLEIGQNWGLIREWVGTFGWLDTTAPAFTYIVWFGAFGAFSVGSLFFARKKTSIAVLGLGALGFLIPIALEVPNVREADYFWQGRYALPILVGVPIIASVGFREGARRLVLAPIGLVTAGAALAIAQGLAFWQALRRYTVGANGTLWFWTDPRWEPALPLLLVMLAAATGIVWWTWLARPVAIGEESEGAVTGHRDERDEADAAPEALPTEQQSTRA
jgi:hypothetical protein